MLFSKLMVEKNIFQVELNLNFVIKKLNLTKNWRLMMKNVLILITAFIIGGCSTVAGVGKDVTDAAEWSKDTMSKKLKSK